MIIAKGLQISVEVVVDAPVEKVWRFWTAPEHITEWNYASEDWFTPKAENDFQIGGHFNYRMEALDGTVGFDFGGVYDDIRKYERINYTMGDGRKVRIDFSANGPKTRIVETFDAENTYSIDAQREGWQAILDNFKKYTEEN